MCRGGLTNKGCLSGLVGTSFRGQSDAGRSCHHHESRVLCNQRHELGCIACVIIGLVQVVCAMKVTW
jgi:hypothetical protein